MQREPLRGRRAKPGVSQGPAALTAASTRVGSARPWAWSGSEAGKRWESSAPQTAPPPLPGRLAPSQALQSPAPPPSPRTAGKPSAWVAGRQPLWGTLRQTPWDRGRLLCLFLQDPEQQLGRAALPWETGARSRSSRSAVPLSTSPGRRGEVTGLLARVGDSP